MAIAAFSTIVEWYDFTLYLYFATVLSRVFFGPGETSLLATLGGFAIAYLMRPLGAVFFGHIGDRQGRRHMMLMSVALMTAAMLATALLPTLFADRRGGRSAADPAALRDGLLGRRRIYRRRRLSARRRAAASARPHRLVRLRRERSRRAARRRRLGADRRLDERSGPRELGLAHPLLRRRRACRNRLDRPLDHGGIARVPPPGRASRPFPTARSATASPIIAERSAEPSPSRRSDRSPITSASPTSLRS